MLESGFSGWLRQRKLRSKTEAALFAFTVFFARAFDGRPPSGQGGRHTVKFTKLVNLRAVLAQPDGAGCGRAGDAPLFA